MFRHFWKSQNGNFAVTVAIASVPMIALMAGAIDTTNTYNKASGLQSALDASALAVGTNYSPGMAAADLNQMGKEFFGANLYANLYADKVGDTDTLADTISKFKVEIAPDDTISVSSTIVNPGFLRSGPTFWSAYRSASVRVMGGSQACMLALNPSASAAVKLQGSTQVSLDGCVVAANSKAADSISRGGSALLKADCAVTVGQTSGLSGSSSKLACGAPLERQVATPDPLRGVNPPTYGCPGPKTGAKTLSPGTYCNQTFSGNITLSPGVYILSGGQIKLGGNGSLVGHGVTIFLLDDASMTINGNQVVDLSPPTSGPYAGITIFQGRDNAQQLTINGTSGSKMSGFVYAPNANIFFAGNSASGSSDCLRLVGDTVEMTGNSAIQSDCKAQLGGRTMYAGRYVTLVK
jgi:Flp pilus assembly protein TadG